ncbi:MAG: thioredoxin family protein [Bergeyella sp.]|nr:thioredoxin family protein [Bergeyella sp.]
MKLGVIVFLCLFSVSFFSAQVRWTSIAEAYRSQKENPKKILIVFYDSNHEETKEWITELYKHPVIYDLINTHFYPVKFDVNNTKNILLQGRVFSYLPKTKTHEFARYMYVMRLPSLVFLDKNFHMIAKLQGVLSAREIESSLVFIGEDRYLKIDSKEDWLKCQKKTRTRIKDK